MVKVMKCDCVYEFQDSLYGKFVRVFNMGKKHYKCTVCGKTKSLIES